MDYKSNELTGLILPSDINSVKEYWRVMGKHSGEIYCVYEIDPDCTLHPSGTEWDPNGVHKGLPFKKGAGVNGLTITGEEREIIEVAKNAPVRKATKEAKRKEDKELEKEVREHLKNKKK